MRIEILVLAIGIGMTLGQEVVDKSLPCKLVWKRTTSGNILTSDSVASHADAFYIVRSKLDNDEDFIGIFDIEVKSALFPIQPEDTETNSSIVEKSSFEILTNPHECILEWLPFRDGEKPSRFSVSGSDEGIIARGAVSDEDMTLKWYGGQLLESESGIYVPFTDEYDELMFLDAYEVLISYSNGVTLEMTDFIFDTDPFANSEDFLGVDEIHNYSPSTIHQTLTHSKKIIEKYKITTNRTWTSKYTETFKLRIAFFTVKKTTEKTYTHSESEVQETTEITEISVSREVLVPEFTSIQACTVISIKECAEVTYRAKAKYSAKGMNSVELLDILKNDIQGAKIDGDFVVVEISGAFTAALAMNTEFIIRPYEASENCDTIRFNIENKKLLH